MGVSLIIAPMYIAEISPPALRGRMVSFNQLNIVIGISVAFFTNYIILQLGDSTAAWAQNMMFGPHNWRWMLGLETLPAIPLLLCLVRSARKPPMARDERPCERRVGYHDPGQWCRSRATRPG